MLKMTDILKKTGLKQRAFEYLQEQGLIPRPKRVRIGKGVTGIYDPAILSLIERIMNYKKNGLGIMEIKAKLRAETITSFNAFLNEKGFSNYAMIELRLGKNYHAVSDAESESLREKGIMLHMKSGLTKEQAEFLYDSSKQREQEFYDDYVLKETPNRCPKEIKLVALRHMRGEVSKHEKFLGFFTTRLITKYGFLEQHKKKKEAAIVKEMLQEAGGERIELLKLEAEIEADINKLKG